MCRAPGPPRRSRFPARRARSRRPLHRVARLRGRRAPFRRRRSPLSRRQPRRSLSRSAGDRSRRDGGRVPRGRHAAGPARGAQGHPPGFQADSARRERLRQEARAAAALSHPGIATVYAIEEIDDELYLACEYVAGPTLRTVIESGPLPAVAVLDLASQLARALAAAHAQGVIHRDLKPENIVRTASGAIKVLDFGVARIENIAGAHLTAERYRHRHAAIHVAGADPSRRCGLPSGSVLVRRAGLRDGGRRQSVRRGNSHRVDRPHPRNRSAAAAISRGRGPRPHRQPTVLRKRREDRYPSTLALVHDLEQLHRTLLDARPIPAVAGARRRRTSGAGRLTSPRAGGGNAIRSPLRLFTR